MPDEFDPFAGHSGLDDNYSGVIVDAWFGTDPAYNNGDTLMLFVRLDARLEDGQQKDITNRYTLGGDWQSFDDGVTVEHPSGPRRGFQNQTQIFEFVTAALATEAGGVIRERGMAAVDANGLPLGPKTSVIWPGLAFDWKIRSETKKFKDRETQEMIERTTNRPLPVKFLGVVEIVPGNEVDAPKASGTPVTSPSPTAGTTPSAPAAPPSPASNGTGTGTGADIPPETRAKLKLLATANATYAEFVDAALPDAMGNDTLIQLLGNESFYEELKG
jgi:hypothetical protein